jgi:hypothetical protein
MAAAMAAAWAAGSTVDVGWAVWEAGALASFPVVSFAEEHPVTSATRRRQAVVTRTTRR